MKLATLCYLKHNGSTLMLHRVKKENDMHEGKWNGLGGKLEEGETPEECVAREVFEESGFHVYAPKLHGFITFPAFDGFEDWYVFVYTVDKFEGEMIDSEEGVLKWVPDEELPKLNLWEGDKTFISWLSQDKFFSAKFNYNNGKLEDYHVVFH